MPCIALLFNNAGSQIAFTTVAFNTYTAIIVEQVEVGAQKHYILPFSRPVTVLMCPLQSEALVDNGSRCNSMQATILALKIE